MDSPVLVIATIGIPASGLARAAVRNRWPILAGPIEPARLRSELTRGRSSVVIVHIPPACVAALDAIRVVRDLWRSALVLAVGPAGADEVGARAAGAGLFLPDTADADLVERTVRVLLGQPVSQSAQSRSGRAHARSAG